MAEQLPATIVLKPEVYDSLLKLTEAYRAISPVLAHYIDAHTHEAVWGAQMDHFDDQPPPEGAGWYYCAVEVREGVLVALLEDEETGDETIVPITRA